MYPEQEYYHSQVALHEQLSLGWADKQSEPNEPRQGLQWLLLFLLARLTSSHQLSRELEGEGGGGPVWGIGGRVTPTEPTTIQTCRSTSFILIPVGACYSYCLIRALPSAPSLWM